MFNKEVKNIIVGTVCCFVGTMLFLGCYLGANLQTKRVDLLTVESDLNDNIANLKVIDICQERFGITKIIFEAKYKDMVYSFYNYTEGEGEGEYKNVSLCAYTDNNELLELRTYPYGTENDMYIAYVSNELTGRMKIAVMFQNMDGERFIYGLENDYELDKE